MKKPKQPSRFASSRAKQKCDGSFIRDVSKKEKSRQNSQGKKSKRSMQSRGLSRSVENAAATHSATLSQPAATAGPLRPSDQYRLAPGSSDRDKEEFIWRNAAGSWGAQFGARFSENAAAIIAAIEEVRDYGASLTLKDRSGACGALLIWLDYATRVRTGDDRRATIGRVTIHLIEVLESYLPEHA